MSEFGATRDALQRGTSAWQELHQTMRSTASDLADTTASALPPGVRPAAVAFLDAWAGHAGRSSEVASGFADDLAANDRGYAAADGEAALAFTTLGDGVEPG